METIPLVFNYSTTEDLPGDDQLLNFVGALIDLADLAVSVYGFQWVLLSGVRQFLDETVAAADVYRVASQISSAGNSNSTVCGWLAGNQVRGSDRTIGG